MSLHIVIGYQFPIRLCSNHHVSCIATIITIANLLLLIHPLSPTTRFKTVLPNLIAKLPSIKHQEVHPVICFCMVEFINHHCFQLVIFYTLHKQGRPQGGQLGHFAPYQFER